MVNKRVFDIGITILFLMINIFLTLYNKSIYHSNDLILLIYVCFTYFYTSRKNYKLLIIGMILSFLTAALINYFQFKLFLN